MIAIHFVGNSDGRARVRWSGAVMLFAALLCACALIPAAGFWLVFGDNKLVSTALWTGFGLATLSCGAIIGTNLRQPVGPLPTPYKSNPPSDRCTGCD